MRRPSTRQSRPEDKGLPTLRLHNPTPKGIDTGFSQHRQRSLGHAAQTQNRSRNKRERPQDIVVQPRVRITSKVSAAGTFYKFFLSSVPRISTHSRSPSFFAVSSIAGLIFSIDLKIVNFIPGCFSSIMLSIARASFLKASEA